MSWIGTAVTFSALGNVYTNFFSRVYLNIQVQTDGKSLCFDMS